MVPVAFVVIGFSVLNRESIVVDPWPFLEPREAPLSAVVLAAAALGFLCGSLVAWISASRSRRRARANARRAEAAEREAARREAAEGHKDTLPASADAA